MAVADAAPTMMMSTLMPRTPPPAAMIWTLATVALQSTRNYISVFI